MKVVLNGGHGRRVDVSQAVADKLTPNAYSCDGQLEKLQASIDLQSEMMAQLIERLELRLLNKQDIEAILGYSYEIVED